MNSRDFPLLKVEPRQFNNGQMLEFKRLAIVETVTLGYSFKIGESFEFEGIPNLEIT